MKERQIIINPHGDIRTITDKPSPELREALLKERRPKEFEVLASEVGSGIDVVRHAIDQLKNEGYGIRSQGDMMFRTKARSPMGEHDHSHLHDLHMKYGVLSDPHLSSKKERLDALHMVYDVLEREGVTEVYNAGDVTDGWGVY